MRLTETAYAKINLALHVRRRRDDGYHDLETLFAFAEDGDVLTAAPGAEIGLTVSGPFAPALAGEDRQANLVVRAARALRDALGERRGATLHLDKRLPVASGIGGGSADAAAALRLLCRLWEVSPEQAVVRDIADSLGADVPACLLSQTMRGEGRGDALADAGRAGIAGTPLLLVNPGVPLGTGSVFAAWDGVDRGPLGSGEPLTAALAGRNDLEAPAIALRPEITAVLAMLAASEGVVLARMSGSGATCFALFDSVAARDLADAAVAAARPDWWRLATALR